MSHEQEPDAVEAVAIIGMAGRFPKAGNLEELWANLRHGADCIQDLGDDDLRESGLDPASLPPNYVKCAATVDGIELFDAGFFGFSPREAEILDPQSRLFLECAWEALEHAGCDPRRFGRPVGLYAGVSLSTYFLHNLASRPDLLQALGSYQVALGTDRDYLTAQVSYRLGLEGPSVDVQTACSTSLVAVHLAAQALLTGDCDLALAGGSSIKVPQRTGFLHQEGGIESPRGRCRAFDAGADGTVHGSGVGIVVLKRLEDALADGDTIHAVILGSAINNDGALKVGLTAPSVEAQARVVAAAQARAGVAPESIGYIETHGTGTPLGDPIEVAALTRAFRAGTRRSGFCPIGSIKTNLGHLGAAAGVTGLIKAVLALCHAEIPPSLHFEAPNPQIDFAASPFYVNDRLAPWPAGDGPRRAGVSAFGLAGTNAHVVLEQAPPAEPSGPGRPWQLLPLSARSEPALQAAAGRLAAWLERHPEAPLADVAWTLQTGRRPLPHRLAVVCRDAEEARWALTGEEPRRLLAARRAPAARPVVFVFPGQGTQHPGMGAGLYASEPLFRDAIDACAERLRPRLGRDLRELLFPPAGRRDEAARALRDTRFAQPALFAVEHALARLWISWGVTPRALIGHSLGEYVAACLAGALTLEDALDLVAARAELMQSIPRGAMLSVDLPEAELAPLLGPGLALAAVNGPALCVAAGPEEEIANLEERLAVRGATARRLQTSHAFHSAMMEPVLGAFAEQVARVPLRAPSLPWLSNLTGGWITAEEATDPGYWVRHLRSTVRFADGVERLLADAVDEGAVFLEVGPGRALGDLVRQAARGQGASAAGVEVVSSMRRPKDEEDDSEVLLRTAGRLWLAGIEVDWAALHSGERRLRLPLPTYPFQRRRFWVEPAPRTAVPADTARPVAPPEPAELPSSPSPAASRPAFADATAAEIAAAFEALLGVEEVGPDDDFFELGGQSLLGTRLISRLRDRLGVELPMDSLFEAPTPAGLALCVAALRAAAAPEMAPLARVPRDGELPLSFAQERLWFLDQLAPGSPAYHLPAALRLEGRLDPPALAAAFTEIVRRHEALRTTFRTVDGTPFQAIGPARPFPLPLVDLAALPEDRREGEARLLARAAVLRPFDLARGSVLRAALLRLGADEHVLAVTLHHIAGDGWSTGVLVRELAALYGAFVAGRPSPLPELAVQYADFAAWQRARLSGATLAAELAGWRERLAGAPTELPLPTDRPRPAIPSYRGGTVPLRWNAELAAGVAGLGRSEGSTLFMTVLAGFFALLGRVAGEDALLVGTPVANRTRSEVEGLIGFFVNTLVLRGDLAGDPSFRELLARVRRTALEAFAHQELPFEKLVEELAPERSLGSTPLFQVLFVLQNAPQPALELPGLTLRPWGIGTATAKFDLSLAMTEAEGGLVGALDFAADLFDRTTAQRLAGHLRNLLNGAVAAPDVHLSGLPLLDEAERAQLLDQWNDTAGWSAPPLAHQDFAARAIRSPEAVAVRFVPLSSAPEQRLSYGKLSRWANRLAWRLRALGVGPEVPVVVGMERSVELVAAVLAVLRAGGAWVPVDPADPEERRRQILEDARPAVILTQGRHAAAWGEAGVPVLCVDRETLAGERETDPQVAVDRAGLAYILYTSGSTGRPKGVQVSHGSLAFYLDWIGGVLDRLDVETLPFLSRPTFDASLKQLFVPLLRGREILLLPDDAAARPDRLLHLLASRPGMGLNCVPAVWTLLLATVEKGDASPPSSLRALLLGGERLGEDLVARTRALLPETAILNLYGPTEGTANATWETSGRTTLGRPVGGSRVHLLDRGLQPVPVGVAGEICVGGTGVARGYLARPALTAERFVPDPWAGRRGEPGARLYRTGDLGRQLPDGRIAFLGRTDHQVKVRGLRVELGEIEAAVAICPGVREAAAVAREGADGSRLVVFWVPAGDGAPDGTALRSHLRRRLPEALLPALVRVEELPRLPGGKVDRRDLASREVLGEALAARVAPRTPVEEMLAGIWAEVLGLAEVGVEDSFFALGGHSLLATRVISRVRRSFGVELPLRDLFEAPTVAGMAARLAGGGRCAALPPIVPGPRDAAPPLSFAQERFWVLDQLRSGSTQYNIPYALRLQGALDPAVLAAALGEVMRRHEVLRARFPVGESGEALQVIDPPAPFVLPVADLTVLPPAAAVDETRRLARAEARRPFDLSRGPLLRALLLRRGSAEHVLIATLHHIASDAWSTGVLMGEVARLAAAFAVGEPSPLPEPELQYGDFARWQRAALTGPVLDGLLAWWVQRLSGVPAVLELPADRPRPPLQSFRGALVPFALSAEAVRGARSLARRGDATLFMVLLAAYQALLGRHSGQERFHVGSPIANRTRAELEGLIGCFVNTLVLPADVSGSPSFAALLARARATALGAYEHQDLPFERLVDEFRLERDLSRTPLFQVVLVLQNAPVEAVELPGLTVRALGGGGGTAKFDLTMTLIERGDGLVGAVELATDLFDPPTAARLARGFAALLTAAAAEPERSVDDLPLLGQEERHQLLREWNDPCAAWPDRRCLHHLFAEHAERAPEAVAVVCEGLRMTYGELDEQANRLARRLRRLGVGPETLVAVFLERSLESVLALLGVLKAGGAYVPLDPSYPRERLVFSLEDTGAPVLLTARALFDGSELAAALERLPSPPAVLRLDADWHEIEPESAADPRAAVDPDHAAYVIFTSGSTGRPKGVQVTHRNAVRLLAATDAWFGFGPNDVWTLFHSYAFDFSVWELWGALARGGRLVVVPYWVSRSPEAFLELLRRERVTVLNQTPSAFQQLARADEAAGGLPGLALRRVLFGGEALEMRGLEPWFRRHGDRRPVLVNMYGITETTVHVTYRPLSAADLAAPSLIGVPIPDLQVHLLDAGGRPVPVGVPGEMYVGGAGVARGYLNRPDLTALRFVPDPFSGRPGARLYRSGDLARRRADGELEYLGRIDHQVKIRGFRIELGEIEAALAAHPQVRQAVVLAREDQPGERRLVAYLVAGPAAGTPPAGPDLRAFLRERLPEHMVPAVFLVLPVLPLTANGKVDRRALPAPVPERPALAGGAAAPRNEAEERLAAVWAEVLRIPRAGIHDNFFELGGDSILAIQIVARARRAGFLLEPRHVFEHQTVAELAAMAGRGEGRAAEQDAVTGPVPLTPIQRWFLERESPEPHHFNQAVLLASREPLHAASLARAVARLVAHHDALRLRLERSAAGWEQLNAGLEGPAPFTAVDLSALPAELHAAAVESGVAAVQVSLDLTHGPLARFVVFDLGPRPARLLIVVHHLAVDGVSWRILLEDLSAAYAQAQLGREIELPPKSASFREWAELLVEHARSAALEGELEHWRGIARAALLPRLVPAGGESRVSAARSLSLVLESDATEALLREVPEVYRTQIQEVLLAALARAFAAHTGTPGLLIDLEGHGREDFGAGLDLSRTVGWFTAIHPVLLELEDPADPGACLRAAKERLRRVPGRGLGWGVLSYLRDDAAAAALRSLPRAEVVFNYLGQLDQALPEDTPFALAPERKGALQSPRNRRIYPLEIAASVGGGTFRTTWTWGADVLAEATVEGLAHAFLESLRDIVAHCRSRQGVEYSPTDFPDVDLTEEQLARALAEIDLD